MIAVLDRPLERAASDLPHAGERTPAIRSRRWHRPMTEETGPSIGWSRARPLQIQIIHCNVHPPFCIRAHRTATYPPHTFSRIQ